MMLATLFPLAMTFEMLKYIVPANWNRIVVLGPETKFVLLRL